MGEPLVIGVGNEWRGDDAAGLAAARRVRTLAGDVGRVGRIRVEEEVRDGAALMERWSEAARVWLIDAAHSESRATRGSGALPAPGTVHRIDAVRNPVPRGLGLASSHSFGLLEAVELARRLGRLPPQLILFAIEAADFSPGREMSPPVARAVEAVAESIMLEISSEET